MFILTSQYFILNVVHVLFWRLHCVSFLDPFVIKSVANIFTSDWSCLTEVEWHSIERIPQSRPNSQTSLIQWPCITRNLNKTHNCLTIIEAHQFVDPNQLVLIHLYQPPKYGRCFERKCWKEKFSEKSIGDASLYCHLIEQLIMWKEIISRFIRDDC